MGEAARRWGRRAFVGGTLAAAAYYLLLGGEYDLLDLRQLERARVEAVARVDSLQREADSLALRAERLARDTLAIERLARERYGFLRDGERLYRFVETEQGRAEPGRDEGVVGSGGRE